MFKFQDFNAVSLETNYRKEKRIVETNKKGIRVSLTQDDKKVQAYGSAVPSHTGGQNTSIYGPIASFSTRPVLEDIVPEAVNKSQNNSKEGFYKFSPTLLGIYKDIYSFDSIAGAWADTISSLLFSRYNISGFQENEEKLKPYKDTLDRLNFSFYFSQSSMEKAINGACVGTLVYDKEKNIFSDILNYDLNDLSFLEVSLYGHDPIIRIDNTNRYKAFINSKDYRARKIVDKLPKKLVEGIRKGKFDLDPLVTIFQNRKTTTRSMGVSYYERLIPIYVIERSLWRGTIIEAQRRQRALLHLTAGDESWEANEEELEFYAQLFLNADADPLGGIVATKPGVQIAEYRNGGDFWSIFNIMNETMPHKLRALGINENFLSGDQNFQTYENVLSIFIQWLKSYRNQQTESTVGKIFPLLSVLHNNLKDGRKVEEFKDYDIYDLIFHLKNDSIIDLPKFTWVQGLEPRGDRDYMEILSQMEEKGIPVPIRAIAVAGGLDIDDIMDNLDDDLKDRKKIGEYNDKKKKFMGEEEGGGGFGGFSDIDPDPKDFVDKSPSKNIGIFRDYGETKDLVTFDKNGKMKPIINQKEAQEKANKNLSIALENLSEKNNLPKKKKKKKFIFSSAKKP